MTKDGLAIGFGSKLTNASSLCLPMGSCTIVNDGFGHPLIASLVYNKYYLYHKV